MSVYCQGVGLSRVVLTLKKNEVGIASIGHASVFYFGLPSLGTRVCAYWWLFRDLRTLGKV